MHAAERRLAGVVNPNIRILASAGGEFRVLSFRRSFGFQSVLKAADIWILRNQIHCGHHSPYCWVQTQRCLFPGEGKPTYNA